MNVITNIFDFASHFALFLARVWTIY